jgi:hypothetical protein
MFYGFVHNGDFEEFLTNNGIVLDFSGCTQMLYTYGYCTASKVPPLNLQNCKKMQATFVQTNLVELTLNNLRADCTFDVTFIRSYYLEKLTITGTIGQNGFDVSACPLDVDSLLNILNCLSTNGAGKTVTLGATNKKTLTDAGHSDKIAGAEAKGWTVA